MKFKQITLQGFRSYAQEQTLDFTKMRPGLYHLTGINKANPELEANGVGKSSLFDGLFWALYGKTSRNLKGPVLTSWSRKNTAAMCIVDMGLPNDDELGIWRTLKPNALEVMYNGDDVEFHPIDQDALNEKLRLSPDAFLYSVYFAQFSPQLVDLRAGQQTEMFSGVLRLDEWERASDNASKAAVILAANVALAKENVARLEGQAEELLKQVSDDKLERSWEKEQAKSIAKETKQRAEAVANLKEVKETFDEMTAELQKAQKHFKLLEDAELLLTELVEDEMNLEGTVTRLSSKKTKTCPECGQVLSKEHAAQELSNYKVELAVTQKKKLEAIKARDKLKKAIPNYPKDADYAMIEGEVSELTITIRTTKAAIEMLKGQSNPYKEQRERNEERGQTLVVEIESAEDTLQHYEAQYECAKLWTKGFKEIRLQLIKESLQQLTVEVNQVLFSLGLPDWEIAFDVESETKSGTVSRGFSISVKSPDTDAAVPWEVWCGGESQRLRLAVAMGFSNLICARVGVQPNIEFWDEPSQWLSKAGIVDLLQVLADRAQSQNKIILLADHRVLDFPFCGIISIVHDEHGSRIQ